MLSKEIRLRYAEDIRSSAHVASAALVRAFATVPREEFVGPGPWKVLSRPAPGKFRQEVEETSDPVDLYRDVGVLLDASRSLANGVPSTLAPWLDALSLSEGQSVFHLGCATGYYTAVIAEIVGPAGRVTAVEIERELATQARSNLARYPNVEVVDGDGGAMDIGARDGILINAGVTHPTEGWLDALRPAGNLVLPMTVEFGRPHVGKGMVLHVRRNGSGYAAGFLPAPVMIYSCTSVRESEFSDILAKSFSSGTFKAVQSLRRDSHVQEPNCWLHASSFCLTTLPTSD